MGKAHSNAWLQANHFFDLPSRAVLHTIAARESEYLERFADQWGWANWTTDWEEAIADPAIDLVDIGTPNHLHRDQAVAALEAGMAVACEKPLAGFDTQWVMEAAVLSARNRASVKLSEVT